MAVDAGIALLESQLAEERAKVKTYRGEIVRMCQIIAEQADFIAAFSASRAASSREVIRKIAGGAEILNIEEGPQLLAAGEIKVDMDDATKAALAHLGWSPPEPTTTDASG